MIERSRNKLHDVLAQAQRDEVCLPAVETDEERESTSGSGARRAATTTDDLRWEGSLSQSDRFRRIDVGTSSQSSQPMYG